MNYPSLEVSRILPNNSTVFGLKSTSLYNPRYERIKSSGVINLSPFFSKVAYLLNISLSFSPLARCTLAPDCHQTN